MKEGTDQESAEAHSAPSLTSHFLLVSNNHRTEPSRAEKLPLSEHKDKRLKASFQFTHYQPPPKHCKFTFHSLYFCIYICRVP